MSLAPGDPAGDCDPRFAAVRDAFRRNFEDHDEIGAGVCVRVGGRTVVDLWGGHHDAARTHPWRRDTLVNAYSVGKGMTAILVLSLAERGEIDLDAPVAVSWPEFAAEGKDAVTVRDLLSHRAGLVAIREPLAPESLYDWDVLVRALAQQRAFWTPGTDHGYHVNTYGFLVGELVRRATGRGFGEVLRQRITGPLGADYHVGLPFSEHARVAPICGVGSTAPRGHPDDFFPPTGDTEHDLMVRHAYFNPAGIAGTGTVNTRAWREACIPSTNGHGTARGVAALYAATLDSGAALPFHLARALRDEGARIHSDGEDRLLRRPSRFGLGFQLAQPTRPIGPNAGAFGHFGYGGSLGFADPDADVAFGYVMNRPGGRWRTPRTQALIDAVYASL